MGAFRAAPFAVVFDGQSFNLTPGPLSNGYPVTVMSNFPTVPWFNVAVGATSWTTLATTVAKRLNPYAHLGLTTVLCMNGGEADLLNEGDSGQTVYDNEVTYADAARTAGFDKVLNITITPSPGYSGYPAASGQNGARLTHNTLLLADADAAFDAKVDVIVTGMDDPTSANYQGDQFHWTGAGCLLVANAVAPSLATLLV